MATRYEVAHLCNQIRRIESIPTSGSTFTDYDLAEIMTLELQSAVVPAIQSVREEYFVITGQQVLPANTVAFDIAPEAIGMRIRDIAIVNPDGTQSFIPRVNPESHSAVFGYIIRNNQVILTTASPTDITLNISIYKRPNDLSIDVVKVISKDANNQITVNEIPELWGDPTDTIEIDIINARVPFVGKTHNSLVEIIDSNTLELDADTYNRVAIGDYVALAGTSPVPQYIPVEAHHLLIQGVAVRCLEALGDKDGVKIAQAKYNRMEANLISLINPRVESQSKKITSQRSIARHMGVI